MISDHDFRAAFDELEKAPQADAEESSESSSIHTRSQGNKQRSLDVSVNSFRNVSETSQNQSCHMKLENRAS